MTDPAGGPPAGPEDPPPSPPAPAAAPALAERASAHQARLADALASGRFAVSDLLTKEALLDSGLPGVVFVTVYAFSANLTAAVVAAVGTGLVLAGIRLVTRAPLQNVAAGFVGVIVCAVFAQRTGRAETYYLPGLFINMGYLLAYLVSILVRWPLIGIVVGVATGEWTAWRRRPELVRAYSLASWFWVAMFGLRLAVQVPLYLDGNTVALGTARVVMGWPLFALTAWGTWLVVRNARAEEGELEELRHGAQPGAAGAPAAGQVTED